MNKPVFQTVVPEISRPSDCSIVAIIALYNGAEFIERSLRTVFSQTRPADEILVVDDGSTDDGARIAEQLIEEHSNARLIRKENGGQSSARNLGVSLSNSSLIAFLDQDDGWYPDHLEKLVQPFESRAHFRLGWVYSDLDRCDRHGRLLEKRMLSRMLSAHPKETLSECLSRDMFVLPSASLISRAAFENEGGFDERLSGYEDDDLFLRLFHCGWENVFLPEPLSFWCIYPGSTSYSPIMSRSRRIYFEKLREKFSDDPHFADDPLQNLILPRFLHFFIREDLEAEQTGNEAARSFVTREAGAFLEGMPWGLRRFMFQSYLLARRVPILRRFLTFKRALWVRKFLH